VQSFDKLHVAVRAFDNLFFFNDENGMANVDSS
jgi:hypothetical protein